MGKKTKKKASNYKDFISMLKENKDKINIMKGEEKISLSDAVTQTVENITAVVKDGIIPISSEEATKKKTKETCNIDIRYAKTPFVLYEYSMKYRSIPQTLVLTLTEDDVEDLFEYNSNQTVTTLMERTDIALILKKMDKTKTKIKNWLNQEAVEDMEMFVVNIPDIVLFTNTIQKKDISKSVLFNLCIQIVKTKKKLSKMKKKNEDNYYDICNSIIDNTFENAVSLGNSYIHVELNPILTPDISDYTKKVLEKIQEEPVNSLINKVIYSLSDTNDMVEATNVIFNKVLK